MNLKQFLFVIVFLPLGLTYGFSQSNINTTIKKNINPLASMLKEDLSVARDSLLLENDLLFSKIRFFNNDGYDKTFYFKPAVKKGKIALNDLPLGSYSVMFYQVDRIIVFRLDRLSKFDNTLKPANAGKNPEILANTDFKPKAARPERPADKTFNTGNTSNFKNMDVNATDFALNTDSQRESQTRWSGGTPGEYDIASTGSSSIIPMDTYLETGTNGGQYGKTTKGGSVLFESERKTMKPYDLSNKDRDYTETREHYRSTHLRPNGNPYN